MLMENMITLIGAAHVFNLSQALLSVFDEKQPEIVCVELDEQRYNALVKKHVDPGTYKGRRGNIPFLYRVLAWVQDALAREYGVTAGDEMLTTITYARTHQLPLMFIDMNAQQVFTRMLQSMPFFEKLRLLLSSLGGFFIGRKQVEKELKKIEGNFDEYIKRVAERFPTVKQVLIDERNEFMAEKLAEISKDYGKIVAVVGDGHIPGLSKLLTEKNIEVETIRLSEIQGWISKDNSTASFTIEQKLL